MVAQKFKVKVDMIVERESIMSDYDLANTDWFPKFIVIRRMANSSQESEQWQGFVKEIKNNFENFNTQLQATATTQKASITDIKNSVAKIEASVAKNEASVVKIE